MFGNKNSAVPYVRIGGVDRQSVLTSNANGNTPVKEIGVNANGNLIFSTDLTTFKSVLDLKYSQFRPNDENQDDTWGTEKSVSMRASGTLEDGTAKETGVIVSKEYVAMVNASMKGDLGTTSQVSVADNDITLYSTDGNSTTYLTVTPTGAKVHDKEIATKSDIPSVEQSTGTSTTATMSQNAITSAIPTALSQLSEDTTHRVVTDTEKTTWNAKSNFDGDYNSLTNKPTIPTNADFTLAGLKEKSYNSLTDKPTIPTKTSQLTNDSNFMNTSDASISKNLTGTTTITINGVSLSLSVSNGTLTIS